MKKIFLSVVLFLAGLPICLAQGTIPGTTTPFLVKNINQSGNLTQPETNAFWSDSAIPATIQRLNQRAFFADATKNNGTNGSCPNGDWWSAVTFSLGQGCEANVSTVLIEVNPYSELAQYVNPSTGLPANASQAGLSIAVQSYNMIHYGTPKALGLYSYTNSPTISTPMWGIYSEHWLTAGSTNYNSYGWEMNLVSTNSDSATNWTPYSQPAGHPAIIGILITAGADAGGGTHYHPTVGLLFGKNPDPLASGIQFGDGSVGFDGPGGRIMAIAFPFNYEIDWFTGGTTVGASITADDVGRIAFSHAGGQYMYVNSTVHRMLCSTSAVDLTPVVC